MCKVALLFYYIGECQNYLLAYHRKLEVNRGDFLRVALLFDQQAPKYNQLCRGNFSKLNCTMSTLYSLFYLGKINIFSWMECESYLL